MVEGDDAGKQVWISQDGGLMPKRDKDATYKSSGCTLRVKDRESWEEQDLHLLGTC